MEEGEEEREEGGIAVDGGGETSYPGKDGKMELGLSANSSDVVVMQMELFQKITALWKGLTHRHVS